MMVNENIHLHTQREAFIFYHYI